MARISTYQHDAMPHADDNVIGTNQSPGHANETVLFRIGAIEELVRNGLLHIQQFTRSDYDNRFYDDLSNLVNTNAGTSSSDVPDTGQGEIPRPSITVTHELPSAEPAILLVLSYTPIILGSDGIPVLGDPISIGQVPADNTEHPYTITYGQGTVNVEFQFTHIYSGTIIIIG